MAFGFTPASRYSNTRQGATGMRSSVIGESALVRELEAAPSEAKKLLWLGLWRAAQIIRKAAVDGIRRPPKTGRWYKRKTVKHRASAPGEWPAADTGNLMRGIQQNRAQDDLAVDVVSTAAQSAALEMKPPERGGRPFLSRAFQEKLDEAVEAVRTALEQIFPADRKATRE